MYGSLKWRGCVSDLYGENSNRRVHREDGIGGPSTVHYIVSKLTVMQNRFHSQLPDPAEMQSRRRSNLKGHRLSFYAQLLSSPAAMTVNRFRLK
jgi:hypothetical protein